jgi:lipopolysaccharide export system protein LptA
MKGLTYTIAAMIVLVLVHPASAQVIGEVKGLEGFKGKRGPVTITSQRLEAEYEKRLITYIGDVVAIQEDFTLYADRLLLFLNDETKGIEKIVAQGNVRMVQTNKTVTCQQATYYYEEGKLVLGGEQRVMVTILPDTGKK